MDDAGAERGGGVRNYLLSEKRRYEEHDLQVMHDLGEPCVVVVCVDGAKQYLWSRAFASALYEGLKDVLLAEEGG